MKQWRSLLKEEDGNVLALVSLSFMSLLMMAGLVIDGGMIYMTKAHLEKVANATALSSAQELTRDEVAPVKQVMDTVLQKHGETESLFYYEIHLDQRVEIDLKKTVQPAFFSLFGIDSVDVTAEATATIGAMGKAEGAAPLGIPESVPLVFGQEYQLKVDSDGVNTGNFGILALDGPGAKLYEQDLRYGYDEAIQYGDIINTQTGNVAGKTTSVINELVNTCNSPLERDCPRVLLILIYQPYQQVDNQLKQVKVTGFAYFYITQPMSTTDTSIKGIFLERTGTGFTHPNAVNRGAYTIRLTE